MKAQKFIIAKKSAHGEVTFFDKNFTMGQVIIPQFIEPKNAKKFNSKAEAKKILNKFPKAIKDDCIII
jgi:hypothetical protein